MVVEAKRQALENVPVREDSVDSRHLRRGWLEHWFIPERLEMFAQRGARHGVSYAYPMLDLDLISYAVRIPSVLLKQDGLNRAVFRDAMKGILPDQVRLKADKLMPFPAETLRHSMAKSQLLEALAGMQENPAVTAFVDIANLSEYIANMSEPDEIRAWMNETAEDGAQIDARELYHSTALTLAWYLNLNGHRIE